MQVQYVYHCCLCLIFDLMNESLRVLSGKLSKWEPWKVAKFHTNPYNFVACLPNPYKLSILGDIWRATILPFSSSKYFYLWLLVDLLFEYLSFSNKRKTYDDWMQETTQRIIKLLGLLLPDLLVKKCSYQTSLRVL